jgi:oligopeptide transport system substrate-binding protein
LRLVVAAVTALFLAGACGQQAEQVDAVMKATSRPASISTLHRGNGGEPDTMDPHKGEGTSGANIRRDLFEGLVSTSPDGSLEPGAAESWEISADRMTYTFRLRPDGRWSNGDPVTAEDFVYGLRRSVDPATLSKYSQVLAPILNAEQVIQGELPPAALGVEALDELTLVIRLKGPTPYFLELLTHSTTYPVHRASVERYGDRFARPGNLVSNGAYVLDEWVVQSHIRLVKNPYYYGADGVRIETVYYYSIENPSVELKRYRAGELDWTDSVPHQQLDWIRENMADELRIAPYFGSYYYGFNVIRPPFKDQPGLRRALSMVVDRDIITAKVTGAGELPAYTYVPPVAGYEPPAPEWASWPWEERLEEARRLYREAGYSEDNPLEVELRYNTNDNHRRLALAVAAMWKQALGVRCRLLNEEFKVFLDTRTSKAVTEVFRAAWIGDYQDPFSFLEIMHSTHGQNDTGYSNPAYDALIEDSMVEPDPVKRMQMLKQAETILLDDQPVLPLFFYVQRRMVKPWVRGWDDSVLDYHPTRHMYIDHAESSR